MKLIAVLLSLLARDSSAKNLQDRRKLTVEVQCLEAAMQPFGSSFPNADGMIEICFSKELSGTSATLKMDVAGLETSITDGGVHIHEGTSCDTVETQMGHYFNSAGAGEGEVEDPWNNTERYSTSSSAIGTANFQFDQWYGYDDTVGKVVIIHESSGNRIACGVLEIPSDDGGDGVVTAADSDPLENSASDVGGVVTAAASSLLVFLAL